MDDETTAAAGGTRDRARQIYASVIIVAITRVRYTTRGAACECYCCRQSSGRKRRARVTKFLAKTNKNDGRKTRRTSCPLHFRRVTVYEEPFLVP